MHRFKFETLRLAGVASINEIVSRTGPRQVVTPTGAHRPYKRPWQSIFKPQRVTNELTIHRHSFDSSSSRSSSSSLMSTRNSSRRSSKESSGSNNLHPDEDETNMTQSSFLTQLNAARFPGWMALTVFSAICLAALNAQTVDRQPAEKWVLAATIISMTISLASVSGYLCWRHLYVGLLPEMIVVRTIEDRRRGIESRE